MSDFLLSLELPLYRGSPQHPPAASVHLMSVVRMVKTQSRAVRKPSHPSAIGICPGDTENTRSHGTVCPSQVTSHFC